MLHTDKDRITLSTYQDFKNYIYDLIDTSFYAKVDNNTITLSNGIILKYYQID